MCIISIHTLFVELLEGTSLQEWDTLATKSGTLVTSIIVASLLCMMLLGKSLV